MMGQKISEHTKLFFPLFIETSSNLEIWLPNKVKGSNNALLITECEPFWQAIKSKNAQEIATVIRNHLKNNPFAYRNAH